MGVYSLLDNFSKWRLKHNITDKQLIIFLSIFIGVFVGFAAVLIKNGVFFIRNFLTNGFSSDLHTYLYFIYPTVGIFTVIVFCKYIIKHKVEHGIPSVLYAISKSKGIIKRHNLFSSVVTSWLTVGFGGSVGLEGPTVATGAAIGSNIGKLFNFNYKQITLLLGCASAGAMSAIFKAPIAAVVFALEVIMLDLTMSSLVPLLISSATAALTSYFFLGQDVLYSFDIQEKFKLLDIPFYIILGILTGLVSVYFIRMYKYLTHQFEKIKRWRIRLLIGGATLGILIFIFPSLYGEGYDAINQCLHGDISYLFERSSFYTFNNSILAVLILLLLVILFKVIATTITFGGGGVGGIFAPSLFVGANTGLLFAKLSNSFNFSISEQNFALVGMAGLLSGVIHAPLTAIFLIAEITSGYDLFMPLMITSTISFAILKIFERNSVYNYQLAERGELITHDKDKSTFLLLDIDNLIETNFEVIHPKAKLKELIQAVSKSKRNVFPIVDDDGMMAGILTLNDIRKIMFKPELYNTTEISHIMYFPETYVSYYDTLEQIADKIESSGRYNVPVLKNGKYIGFVSRAKVFSAYRKLIKDFSEE